MITSQTQPAASMQSCDVLVVGGGTAGLCAALGAAREGAHVVICEREGHLGGILNQCIHNGFGLHRFGEELTGPEYAARDIEALAPFIQNKTVEIYLNCSVLSLAPHPEVGQVAELMGDEVGAIQLHARSTVLACGCRERTRAQIGIPGTRPAGVMCAGAAQRLCNIDGAMAGRNVVILGSGDIGLIMARRMTWEGAHVICVCELMSEPGGLRRNIVQCLEDNDIPLYLSCTVTNIFGSPRLSAVELSDVDPATLKPIPGTEQIVPCDTLLLSVGLIPDTVLAKGAGAYIDPKTSGPAVDQTLQSSLEGLFVAGNELHVHDLADFVSEEGIQAGQAAAAYARAHKTPSQEAALIGSKSVELEVSAGQNVGSVTPQRICGAAQDVSFRLRSRSRVEHAELRVVCGDMLVKRVKRRVVIPSEMQTIKVSAEALEGLTGELVVECVSA